MGKCHTCAYKGNIPGDAHICCKLNWLKVNSDPPKASDHGIRSGWYMFPFNFDPIWQEEEECSQYSENIDDSLYLEGNSYDLLLSALMSRR